jgi:hypothetical protein
VPLHLQATGMRLAPDNMNLAYWMVPPYYLGIEPRSNVIGSWVVFAHRKVSGFFCKPVTLVRLLEIKGEFGFSGPVGGKSCDTEFRYLISMSYAE